MPVILDAASARHPTPRSRWRPAATACCSRVRSRAPPTRCDGARDAQGGRGGLRGGRGRPHPAAHRAQASSPEEGSPSSRRSPICRARPRTVSTELERRASDALAERWRTAWQGSGFEPCCTPTSPTRIRWRWSRCAASTRSSVTRSGCVRPSRTCGSRRRRRRYRAERTCASWRASAPSAATSGRCCRRATAT